MDCKAGSDNLQTGGVDLQRNPFGHGWQWGLRNAPTMLNAVVNIAQFCDGRAKDLREQVTDNRPSSRL